VRVRRVITSRRGGVSEPPFDAFNLGLGIGDDAAAGANRERLRRELDLPERALAWMRQRHTSDVAVLSDVPDQPPTCDALVTDRPGIALAVLVADCVPVLLADHTAGVVGAVHAGREGSAAGVVRNALIAMGRLGATPAGTEALLGPAICGACYEVPPAMQADIESRLPGSSTTTRKGTTGLDLRAGLARQLAEAGVGRVVHDHRCTAEDGDLFSYRRDGRTGRQAGVVWLS
jgi:purine-nucleoside/S-methyl-5'-thioadenosine phosphorylase / adenosine deaminase